MPAHDGGATRSGGRRTKTSKGGNRGKWDAVVERAPDLFRRAFEDSVASAVVLHFDRLGGGGVTCKFEKQPPAKRPPVVVDDQVLIGRPLQVLSWRELSLKSHDAV